MNVNYIMNVLHDCWEGDVLKETTMANERWWKGPGMVALTSTEPVPYWFLLAQKDQRNSLTLEWISRQIGRWGGSSRVNEGMGVNCPSVTAPKPDRGLGNSRHMQSCREKAREEVWYGGRRTRATGIAEENWRKLWKHTEC